MGTRSRVVVGWTLYGGAIAFADLCFVMIVVVVCGLRRMIPNIREISRAKIEGVADGSRDSLDPCK